MTILLDTHYAYAIVRAPSRLSQAEIEFLETPPDRFCVSAVSVWEMRLKWGSLYKSGRPKGPMNPAQALNLLSLLNLDLLPLSPSHAASVLATPLKHHDPFDELLLIQAQTEGMKLLTRDSLLEGHPLTIAI